MIKVKGVFDIF